MWRGEGGWTPDDVQPQQRFRMAQCLALAVELCLGDTAKLLGGRDVPPYTEHASEEGRWVRSEVVVCRVQMSGEGFEG